MKEYRKTILNNCNLTFTGVIQKEKKPYKDQLWINAINYGAKCYEEYSNEITHVVVGKSGTYKTYQGKTDNKYVVSLDWFQDSIWNWLREPENNYKIE